MASHEPQTPAGEPDYTGGGGGGLGRAPLLILLLVMVIFGAILLYASTTTALATAPDQPIDFFHRIHAGERQIACGYCHRTAETAAFAGMPSTQLCISCHRVVLPNNPEIWKLRSFWELEASIPWNRTHDLPDHVYFSHEAHTTANVACAECHGPV